MCGGRVRIIAKNQTGMKARSYQCVDGHASAHEAWVDDRVEAIILHRLSGEGDVVSELTDTASVDVAAMREKLDHLRYKADDLVEMYNNDEMTRDQFNKANQTNRQRIEELQRALAKVGLDDALASLLDVPNLKEHWRETMTVMQKHAVVKQFFDKIILQPRGRKNAGSMKPGDVEFYVPGFAEPIL